MKISVGTGGYDRSEPQSMVDFVRHAEAIGVEYVWSAEAWGTDAVSPIAFLAGQTTRITLGTGIMQISARVPSMIAMTALTLAELSKNRFVLGLGVSGPQVVEGLHGVDYRGPLSRLRETVEIVRAAFRGEKLEFDGEYHKLPRPNGEGKAIRLDHRPRRIPIFLATLSPRSLEYTGASADGWLGTTFSPDFPEAHFAHLRKGAESAGRSLGDIELNAACAVVPGDNVEELIAARKPAVAFNLGAMGSATTNFYNDAFQRAGFVDDALAVQALWLAGKREEAAARVPDEMVTQFSAIGTPEMIRARFQRYADVGINCLHIRMDSIPLSKRYDALSEVVDMARSAGETKVS